MNPGHGGDPLSYRAVRLRYCVFALKAFLRRWGTYLFVGACVGGVGAPALAAWAVLPLFWSIVHPVWAAAVVLTYTAIGAGLLCAMRSLLWPATWAESERALPIPRRVIRLSDLQVVAMAMTPLALLYAAGTGAILSEDPEWLRPYKAVALAALCLCLLCSAGLAVAGLQVIRRERVGHAGPKSTLKRSLIGARAGLPRVHWAGALIWAPLWRGPAKRTGHALVFGAVLLALPALALPLCSDWASGWMAGHATLSLLVATRINALSRLELEPVLAECGSLPISPRMLRLGRATTALLPGLLGMAMLLAAISAVRLRPLVLCAFVAVSFVSWLIEVLTESEDPATKGMRWLFSLVLLVALATESVA